MERLVCSQGSYANFFGFKAFRQSLDGRDRAADDLVRAVVNGDAQFQAVRRRVVLANCCRHLFRRGEHRRHGAQFGNRREQGAALRHEPQAVFQAEHPGRLRRRVLPEAVADDHAGFNPNAAPQGGKRALQRIGSGLRPGGIVQVALRTVAAEHHVQQRRSPLCRHDRFAPVEHHPNHRLALIQRLAHARPLGTLAGIDERRLRRRSCFRTVDAIRNRFQAGAQQLGILERHAGAVREVAAPDACRPCHVGEQGVRGGSSRRQVPDAFVEPGQVTFRGLPQRLVRFSRQRQQPCGARGEVCFRGQRLRHRLGQGNGDLQGPSREPLALKSGSRAFRRAVPLHHHVRVGARPPEPVHAGQRRPVGGERPVRGGGRDSQG